VKSDRAGSGPSAGWSDELHHLDYCRADAACIL
jgi:hypothetical protein